MKKEASPPIEIEIVDVGCVSCRIVVRGDRQRYSAVAVCSRCGHRGVSQTDSSIEGAKFKAGVAMSEHFCPGPADRPSECA